jgi:radical SAM protein with 4Fe4S-binding SPASM domain
MRHFELEACRERLEEYLAAVLYPAFGRSQQRKWGSVYARGLLLEDGRKSAGAMAERLPDGNEQSLQQFISQSTWYFREVRQRVVSHVLPQLRGRGQFIIDDTGFPKWGNQSVGVARQYSGTLGKIGNCQIGVSLHYGTSRGSLPLDFELYLPDEVWTDDPARCQKAGVPGSTIFKAKWELALGMLDRVRRWALREEDLPQLDAEYDRLAALYLAEHCAGRSFTFYHFNVALFDAPCLARRLSGCGAGHEYLAVTPSGDLYPCHQFVGREGFRMGDIFSGELKRELVERFRATDVLSKPACRECWARFHCSGGCHANAHLFSGTLAEPYALGCALQRKRIECALAVQAALALEERPTGTRAGQEVVGWNSPARSSA